jgi:hypothetical protein
MKFNIVITCLPKLPKLLYRDFGPLGINEILKNENKYFGYLFLYGFSTQFPNIITKTLTLYSTKVLTPKIP